MNKRKIRQLTVKIFNMMGAYIGSGTLFVPRGDGKYAYIFTAAHVAVLGIDEKKLKFKMLLDEQEKDFETNNEDSIKLHEEYDKNADVKEYDVAVIKINREDWMHKLPTLTIGSPKENEEVQGQGFPKGAHESKLIFNMMELEGKIVTCSNQYKRFQLNIDNKLNLSNRDSELEGYSGSGLYEKRYEDEELVLVGIFSYGQGQNAIQNTTNSFHSELLRDICKKYRWEEPEQANQVPSSFEPYACEAISLIENNKVEQQIHGLIEYIIESGFKPSNLIKNKDDIYDIPKCISKDRVRCKECWIARLQLICILIILGVKIENLRRPCILIEGDNNIPIEFFCSEGSEGDAQMKKVVRSIYDKGFTWNSKFRENAILVWASKGKQTHKIMNRTKFNRIIGNISNELIYKCRQFDTMYGDRKKNNLSIIHIDELMKLIDVEEDEDINNNLLEALKNVIS